MRTGALELDDIEYPAAGPAFAPGRHGLDFKLGALQHGALAGGSVDLPDEHGHHIGYLAYGQHHLLHAGDAVFCGHGLHPAYDLKYKTQLMHVAFLRKAYGLSIQNPGGKVNLKSEPKAQKKPVPFGTGFLI
jgi:hypothetical protein